MSEFRVPIRPVEAELRYFDERPLRGRLFIPSDSQRNLGPMGMVEWMNQTSGFFAFVAEGEETARILNKRYVVVLTLAGAEAASPAAVVHHVIIECGTIRLEGRVHVEMPDHASRLLDWLNSPAPFLMLHGDGERHIVQKQRITFLSEVQEV
jgi:hypothetical protein